MSARWMYDRGLIARIAPKDELEDEVQNIVRRLSKNAPLSLKAMKAMIVRQLAFRNGVTHEDVDAMVKTTRTSNDSKEGVAAKVERAATELHGNLRRLTCRYAWTNPGRRLQRIH